MFLIFSFYPNDHTLNISNEINQFDNIKMMGFTFGDDDVILLIILGILLYFLPSIIGRNKRNFVSIMVLNTLLGWTFIGWLVSLIWSLSKDDEKVVVIKDSPNIKDTSVSISDELIKLKELKDNNIISEEEFIKLKDKLINQI